MKIRLKNFELEKSFIPALREMALIKTNAKVAYNTARTFKSSFEVYKPFEDAKTSILETRCDKVNGKPKIEEQQYVFSNPVDRNEALLLVNDLENKEVEFEIFPIELEDFGDSEITASIIYSLREFIKEPELKAI